MVDFKKTEKKWQSLWEKDKVFKASARGKKFYNLDQFPYPSSYGLHMGHARTYTINDVNARYKRLKGFSVLHPVGFDSFGLPAENAAIKEGIHPSAYTEKAIRNFIKQQKLLGLSYDWDRLIMSHRKEYYKWDQWLFLKFFEEGLAYRKFSEVNWCEECNTVLANEQVVNGYCWRHSDCRVELKKLEQWFFRTTKYADELLKGIEKLKWPEKIKEMQRNWIGRSEGVFIDFMLDEEKIKVFTTRPDTLYGVTFIVFAPEHPKVAELTKGTKYEKDADEFIQQFKEERDSERIQDKKGMFIGKYAVNPINNEKIPVFVGNFVLYEYGTGVIMAVPAHDQRDFEFAKKHALPVKEVIKGGDVSKEAYESEGVLVNSGMFNGVDNAKAIKEIIKYLEKNKMGKKAVQYKLRDWLISRQRYWGAPIPVIYCGKCGIVPEKNLPVVLPEKVDFKSGGNPLKTNKNFVNVKCPKCGGKAERETNTMDTFVDSSWYFLRYCSPKSEKIFDKEAKFWMPIDQYVGGQEHATGHLIYFRFFTKVIRDLGLLNVDEPALKLFVQGDVNKDGFRMSKSRGNVVDPVHVINKYSTDTLRFFLMFVSSPDKTLEWSDEGIEGSSRFLNRAFELVNKKTGANDAEILNKMHRTIMEVSAGIEEFKFNNCLIKIKEYADFLGKREVVSKESLEVLCKLLNPFCPHITEEMWEMLGNKKYLSLNKWPEFNAKFMNDKLEYEEEFVENTRKDIQHVFDLIKKKGEVTLFVAEKWKFDFFKKLKKEVVKKRDFNYLVKKLKDEKHMNEVVRIIQSVLKDSSKIPSVVLSQDDEIRILKKQGFNAVRSEETTEVKAKQAVPGKVGVLVSTF